jgi:hypothetical protein
MMLYRKNEEVGIVDNLKKGINKGNTVCDLFRI